MCWAAVQAFDAHKALPMKMYKKWEMKRPLSICESVQGIVERIVTDLFNEAFWRKLECASRKRAVCLSLPQPNLTVQNKAWLPMLTYKRDDSDGMAQK